MDRMGTDTQQLFIQIIQRTVCNVIPESFITISDEKELYMLSKYHSMTQIVEYASRQYGLKLDSSYASSFQQQYLQTIRRVVILETEIKRIRNAFEENNIDFIFLKGAVIRDYYPEPWMRVSADIDVLVREKELDHAEEVLTNVLRYEVKEKGSHHDHVALPNGLHVDLHFTLTERKSPTTYLLNQVWDYCRLASGSKYEYVMNDEMFYLFHMFHMSVHFQIGGCGVRPILDTWILNHRIEFDGAKRDELLKQGGLYTFAKQIEQLSERWFSKGVYDDENDIERYVLLDGLNQGSQKVAAVQAAKGSRAKFLLARVFPPYSSLKYGYPILRKLPFLLPLCWLHRLVKGMFGGKMKKARYEMQQSQKNKERSKDLSNMFEKLGLK